MSIIELLLDRALTLIPLLFSLTVHEWAHAWVAWKLGDDTAKQLGRVSLNPFDHLDPLGTLLPLLGVPFGWAKPVPVNPHRFRATVTMPIGLLLTAAAGPLSNLLLAAGASLSYWLFDFSAKSELFDGIDPFRSAAVAELFQTVIGVNLVLALFNLLPVPPLDGSRIADALIPIRLRSTWNAFGSIGPFVLIAVVLVPFLTGHHLTSPAQDWIGRWKHQAFH